MVVIWLRKLLNIRCHISKEGAVSIAREELNKSGCSHLANDSVRIIEGISTYRVRFGESTSSVTVVVDVRNGKVVGQLGPNMR